MNLKSLFHYFWKIPLCGFLFLIVWKLSTRRLFLTLGLALFILVGGVAKLSAHWLPTVLRITHGLEIFADEIVYTGASTLLLGRHATQPEGKQIFAPAQKWLDH